MNGIPSSVDMLQMLVDAGGTLPQSSFGLDWNDAGDFCFRNGLTDNMPDTITINAKGRAALALACHSPDKT